MQPAPPISGPAAPPGGGPASPGERLHGAILTGFVCIALVLGGGGVQAPPILSTLVELAALVALAALALTGGAAVADPRARPAIAFAALVAIVAALQLVPVPTALWQGLPGRAVADQVRTLAGAGTGWHPIALDPDGARASALALIVPIAAFLGTLYSGARGRLQLLTAILILCGVDLLLGTLQLATRSQAGFVLFPTLHAGSAIGFFANRNHNADLLLIAPLIGAALLRLRRETGLVPTGRPAAVALLLIFLLGVLVTGSRAGTVLMVVPLLGVLVLFSSRGTGLGRPSRGLLVAVGALLVLGAGIALLGATNDVVVRTLERFQTSHDPRFDFWPDVLYGIGRLWPVGAGLGSFQTVFPTFERLESVTRFYINHAHSDYFELLFELGLVGAVLIALFLVLLGRAAYAQLIDRRGVPLQPVAVAALFGLVVMLLHSLADYPLRTHGLAALFGVLCAALFAPRRATAAPLPRS